MSAYLVSKAHIDALVTAARNLGDFGWYYDDGSADSWRFARELDPSEIGQMLWTENNTSVNDRYSEDEIPPAYEFKRTRTLDPVVILKAIRCLNYQSCEHDGWKESEAHAFLEALTISMIHNLDGYDEAPGWDLSEAQVR